MPTDSPLKLTSSPAVEPKVPRRRRQRNGNNLTMPLLPANILAYKAVYGREYFNPPEYNLVEVGRSADVESYVRQAVIKKVGLMFKSGWSIVGPNNEVVQYLYERLRQIEQAGGKPFDILLREIGSDLVLYHNAYLVKTRNRYASGGARRFDMRWGKNLDPVAAYFRMSPETVHIKRDIYGNVLQYRQQVNYGIKRVFFDPEDVVHLYVDRRGGFSVGTPALIPVLDDIRALRRLEENIELLVHQHLFPLLHYQVGNERQPAMIDPSGVSELEIVRDRLHEMAAEGCIITPEHHSIEIVSAGSKVLRADWYLEHFKQRIFAGLGMSAVDFGEGGGANRSTAERLSRALVDNVKTYQNIMAAFINYDIIHELLLESTWGEDALRPEFLARFVFEEVDQDAQVKRDAAVINLYHANLITEDEARFALGRQPITPEQRERLHFELIEKPKAIIQALDEPFSTRSTSAPERTILKAGGSSATISPPENNQPENPAARRSKNIVQPTNQHGTKPGPDPRLSSLYESYMLNQDDENKSIHNIWQSKHKLAVRRRRLLRFFSTHLKDTYMAGLKIAHGYEDPATVAGLYDVICQMTQHMERYSTEENTDSQRWVFRYRMWKRRAFLWGLVQAWCQRGIEAAHIYSCNLCSIKQPTISLAHLQLQDLPPYHHACDCTLYIPEDINGEISAPL